VLTFVVNTPKAMNHGANRRQENTPCEPSFSTSLRERATVSKFVAYPALATSRLSPVVMFSTKHQRYYFRKVTADEAARALAALLHQPEALPDGNLRRYVMALTRFYFTALRPEQLEKLQERHAIPAIDPQAEDWEEDIAPLQPQLDLFTELPAK